MYFYVSRFYAMKLGKLLARKIFEATKTGGGEVFTKFLWLQRLHFEMNKQI